MPEQDVSWIVPLRVLLSQRMKEQSDFFMTLLDEMRANYVDTWEWTDMRFGDGNLIAFSSGYGDGVYASYAGFHAEGEVTIILTDFSVGPLSEDRKSGS
jgi:Protein of unknown function (DUF4241)